jgi:hypothetical protein
MPKGRKGERRPADVVDNAIRVTMIATGEAPKEYDVAPEKNSAAAELGRKGGAARARAMTPERRAEIARKAATKRWQKKLKID